jgi:hypothetical protein
MDRKHWAETRRRKETNLYDEWLKEERVAQQRQAQVQQAQAPAPAPQEQHPSQQAQAVAAPPRRGSSTPLPPRQASSSDTAVATQQSVHGATIRTVTPEGETASQDELMPETRGTTSFERAFIPFAGAPAVALGTTTTIIGGPAAASSSTSSPSASGSSSSKGRRLVRERDWDRAGNGGMQQALGRSNSRSNGQQTHAPSPSVRDAPHTTRPRTRTLDEARRRERSPLSLLKNRNRMGSVHNPSSPVYQGAEYLASVPAATSPPSAPSIASLGSPVQGPIETAGTRSISPMSSETTGSLPSTLPPANARRIVHLMKTLNGRMSGNIVFRRGETSPWSQSYCYIHEDTGSLMYEPRGGEAHKTLIPDLRGCSVIPNVEDETPYLEVSMPGYDGEVHVKLLTQTDFDAWFAAFMWWQGAKGTPGRDMRPPSSSSHGTVPSNAPEPPPRTSSARQRHRAGSSKSDRRKSVVNSLREAPVIKIGKMIFWDTNVGYSTNVTAPLPGSHGSRPPAYRTQSYGSRRWRRISGQLRENGELKLHSDADNGLISVVQLSQLSRCAIQRLDPSVLDNDFCIAIYPQYTSSLSNTQPGFIRPIFLSLENRVLHEVWFVLLRAFTMPQLYGPPRQANGDLEAEEDNHLHTTTTNDMFRVERSLSVRIIEAKMFPPTSAPASTDSGFTGGHNNRSAAPPVRPEQHGYYAEVLLDNETRAKTAVKYEGLTPLWGENFDFVDLPPVLSSASVVIKRRPPDKAHAREQHESKLVHEAYGFTSDQHGGYTGLTFDVTCGKVEIYLQELEEKEVEKWWPVVNMYNQRVGEVLIKARAEEGVILMAHDYQPLSELLHRFSNGLTLQISQMVPGELKRLSDCLLNIYQVSGKAGEWIQALVEEEIDGIHKETPISRLRYSRRIGSNEPSNDGHNHAPPTSDRELIVRDLNKNATLEANLLFRGNTLLTKSLDTHMRRVGREYLEHCLSAKIREINEKDPDCEVDPNRVASQPDVERNWRRLLLLTQEVWKAIVAAKQQCPIELRMIFRHIRACAEDRYGDFLRSVSYSSVSGFLFLRFFCPAVLNPKLFGLLKGKFPGWYTLVPSELADNVADDIKPRARRTFTLIAKSLQTLANMASFGTKEHWMEPMNAFLTQHRESFKAFIDDVCYVPTPLSGATYASSSGSSPNYASGAVSAETHLSYTTPMTIMQRLPPTSREGFPSLPYLIDQARAFADLVQLWMEITSPPPAAEATTASQKRHSEIINAIHASEGDMVSFHQTCVSLSHRTQECLSRAERAERPASALSFRWEELIDQLQSNRTTDSDDLPDHPSFDPIADRIASDPTILPPGMDSSIRRDMAEGREPAWDPMTDEDDEEAHATRYYDQTPPHSSIAPSFDANPPQSHQTIRERRGSASLGSSIQGSLRRALQSRGSDHTPSQPASASAINVSSAVSSDTEHTTGTTALPSYEREVRHRERREAAKVQIQQQVEEAKIREREKEKRRVKTPLAALRKKRDRDASGRGPGEGERS